MFSEILHIKTRLDTMEAKKMENDLSRRFTNVARTFSRGLTKFSKIALGGSIIGGIGLNLVNKILNPLGKIDERIKTILSRGETTANTAEAFGGTAGQLFQLEQVGAVSGLTAEQVHTMLKEFQERQVLGRQELANPQLEQHKSTEILGDNLIKNENAIEAFTEFLKQLQGKTYQEQTVAERAVFNEKQTGAPREFISAVANLEESLKTIGASNIGVIEERLRVLKELSEQDRRQKAIIDTKSLVEQSARIDPQIITNINKREAAQQAQLTGEMADVKGYQQLQATADKLSLLLDGLTKKLGEVLVRVDNETGTVTYWLGLIHKQLIRVMGKF